MTKSLEDPSRGNTTLSPRARLVFLSFLMLFIELLLIRWAAAFVIYISYFTNFVLLGSFLGIGIGFLRSTPSRDPLDRTPVFLALFLVFVVVFPVQVSRVSGRSFVGLFGVPALPIWVTLPAIFVLTVLVMATIAGSVARTFGLFEPLTAYRYDIIGSVLGIVVFSGLAFASAPPLAWGAVVLVVTTLLLGRPSNAAIAGLAVLILVLGVFSYLPGERWSPYYRVSWHSRPEEGTTSIRVNGLPHQSMLPLELLDEQQPFYLYPYRYVGAGQLSNVLVIGAGSGNDVAVALSHGARHVDAVEIDPVILDLGGELHPDEPYNDDRVDAHVDDGRAFLERTAQSYDLIVFALPDSLTLVSGQAALRLESYLFTAEALQEVRSHLSPDGVFTMYNYYRLDVFERFAATMTQAFGHQPCIDRGPGKLGVREQAVLTIGRDEGDIRCTLAGTLPSSQRKPQIATDDYPFPYLGSRSIPTFYAVVLALILVASILSVRMFGGRLRDMSRYADLFFMGAAFLLLETKNIVQFALLFGTTWFVNALVFTGILLAVLAAIEITRRCRLPRPAFLYAILLAALAVAWLVPPASLLSLSVVPRFAAAALIAFAPVLVANLIFSQRFKDVSASTLAFGANLLGAMVGGILEYGAMIIGYRSLLIVVGAVYLVGAAISVSGRESRAA